MAKRENHSTGGLTTFTFSIAEMLALKAIIEKISRDKAMTELWQYRQAGNFAQLFDLDRESGDYRISGL